MGATQQVEGTADLLQEDDGTRCRHCGGAGRYARRLCFPCWFVPEIRRCYGPMIHSDRAKCRGVGLGNAEPKSLAAAPTSHTPGSPGKVDVLCERARLGVSLWHPLDAKEDLK